MMELNYRAPSPPRGGEEAKTLAYEASVAPRSKSLVFAGEGESPATSHPHPNPLPQGGRGGSSAPNQLTTSPVRGLQSAVLVTAARALLGTPFVHQGRCAGAGVDCAGLVILAARAAGVQLESPEGYALPATPEQILTALNQLQPSALITTGSVLLFRLGGQPQHLALATSPVSMIHAYAPVGKVVETTIGQAWMNRLIGIYAIAFHERTKTRTGLSS